MTPRNAPNALEIPELLIVVLKYGDRDLLSSAILVNRLWFECGFPLLWQFKSAIELASVRDIDRRQMYASQLRTLRFDRDDINDSYKALQALAFPNMKELKMAECLMTDKLLRYLRPQIEKLTLEKVDWTDKDLELVAESAHHLKDISLGVVTYGVFNDSIARFLGTCLSAEKIRVYESYKEKDPRYGPWRVGLADNYFLHLARLPHLKSLYLIFMIAECITLTGNTVKNVVADVREPFASLRALRIRVSYEAVPTLCQLARGLTELDIDVDGQHISLEAMATLTNIRCLKLFISHTFTKRQVYPLASLHLLNKLTLWSPILFLVDGPNTRARLPFLDRTFIELISSLPLLTMLEIDTDCRLSVAFLCSLARHCPRLRYGRLRCLDVSLTDLFKGLLNSSPTILSDSFCRELVVGDFIAPVSQDMEAARLWFISAFREIFPTIKSVSAALSSRNGFGRSVASGINLAAEKGSISE